ncbi:uncharacterized protein [Onthophagus taurus]|uniref:uncharacterized protein n=1 Tax=Onthophagus taurus TaxID=166361 RepID=UPI0039BE7826
MEIDHFTFGGRSINFTMILKLITLFLCLHFLKCETSTNVKDSYIKAYDQSKVLNKKSDPGEYGFSSNGFPSNGYSPSGYHPSGYQEYEKPYYGPPKVYGPPQYYPEPNYPPHPPPQQPYGPKDQFLPHALLTVLDKIKYKIDLLTIGKIILKLVIFKKIVSFIGILCLLLFIPSLKKKHLFLGGGNLGEDMFRSLETKNLGDEKIENISTFLADSIQKFSQPNNESVNCKSMFCKSQRLSKYINNKYSYDKLISLYSNELS